MGYKKDILYEEFVNLGMDVPGSKIQIIEIDGDIIYIMLTGGVLLQTDNVDYYDNLIYYPMEFDKDNEIESIKVIRYNHVYSDWRVDEFIEYQINLGDEVIRIIYDVSRDVGETSIRLTKHLIKVFGDSMIEKLNEYNKEVKESNMRTENRVQEIYDRSNEQLDKLVDEIEKTFDKANDRI